MLPERDNLLAALADRLAAAAAALVRIGVAYHGQVEDAGQELAMWFAATHQP